MKPFLLRNEQSKYARSETYWLLIEWNNDTSFRLLSRCCGYHSCLVFGWHQFESWRGQLLWGYSAVFLRLFGQISRQ